MEDHQIIELYWQKNADAISETASKYGAYCFTIADHILHSVEDSEECVNDTTFLDDGPTEQYFYLTQDVKTGEWTITDNDSPRTRTEQ